MNLEPWTLNHAGKNVHASWLKQMVLFDMCQIELANQQFTFRILNVNTEIVKGSLKALSVSPAP